MDRLQDGIRLVYEVQQTSVAETSKTAKQDEVKLGASSSSSEGVAG
eukprot:CAMPEP_0197864348 /NCGR_PEP_ID=MMETSP1438-20131217/42527_1 /TAXON_ID=1461541 /ORGANISM="Pterosperma sp., Strain CCMP1384" /LENGTH=45 /DNA_ID= /DNA_START= /DNA_END= /DNA_ORIENTATION=